MLNFLRYAAEGLTSGAVIALLAMGIVIVYRSTRVLSFAHGAIATLSTYVYYQLNSVWHVHALVALLVALLASIGLGVLAHVAVMRPLAHADAVTKTVATLGLVLVLQVVIRSAWHGGETFVKPFATGQVRAGTFILGAQTVVIGVVAFVVAVVLITYTRRTYTGLGLSAIAENPDAARLLGVSPDRAGIIAWSLSSVLAALAGILYTPLLVLNPWQMTLVMVTSFGAALAGGFTSIGLAVAGGLAIGIAQSLVTGYVNISGLSETIGFVAVFAVLLLSRARRTLEVRAW